MPAIPATPRLTLFAAATASAGPYDIGFRMFSPTGGVEAYVNGTKTSAFTLTVNLSDGYDDAAKITFDQPLAAGDAVVLVGAQEVSRPDDYQPGDPGLTRQINNAETQIIAAIQDLQRVVRWCVRVLPGSPDLEPFAAPDEDQVLLGAAGGGLIPGPSIGVLLAAETGAAAAAATALTARDEAEDFRDDAEDVVAQAAATIAAAQQRVVVATLPNAAAFATETELTYDPTETGIQILPGMAVITRHGTYVIVARDAATYHVATAQDVRLREGGPLFTSEARLAHAVSEGDVWPDGTLLFAGRKCFLVEAAYTAGAIPGLREVSFLTGAEVTAAVEAVVAARMGGDPAGVQSPTRASGTVYQNATLRVRRVAIRRSASSSTTSGFDFRVAPTAAGLDTDAAQIGWTAIDAGSSLTYRFNPQGPFDVPPGWFYRFEGAFDFWKEY